jgi:hypothetical protein
MACKLLNTASRFFSPTNAPLPQETKPKPPIISDTTQCMHHCNGLWQHIKNSIDSQVNDFMDKTYLKLNKIWTH